MPRSPDSYARTPRCSPSVPTRTTFRSPTAARGLENKLVNLIATDLHLASLRMVGAAARVRAQYRCQARCDLWPGVAAGIGSMATSRPYYRSTYVFVTRGARTHCAGCRSMTRACASSRSAFR